ncbi:MAG TPA: helix-turn-helix domain-containing protein [Actinomycetes bacterium]|nr:helix-turn-helix domain-containing protein [Actinomycetes bacterium]
MVRPDNGQEVWIQDQFGVLGEGSAQLVQGLMIDVTRQHADAATIGRQLEMLQRAEQIGHEFTELVVNRGDITRILEVLAATVGNPVVLTDQNGTMTAFCDGGSGQDKLFDSWERHSLEKHTLEKHTATKPGTLSPVSQDRSKSGELSCLWQDICIRDESWGRLHVLLVQSPLDRVDEMAVDRAVAAVGLALLVERESGRLNESARGALVSDLAHGRVASGAEFLRRCRSIGTDLGRGALSVLVVEPAGSEPRTERTRQSARRELARRIDAALTRVGWRYVCGSEGDRVVAVVGVPTDTETREALSVLADRTYRVGVSDVVNVGQLPRAYQQAAEAVRHAGRQRRTREGIVTHFGDLGLTSLLTLLAEGPDLARFVEVELGPLRVHDRTHGAVMIPTLQAYLAENGSKTAAAKRLHVERRTLYYRLDRITQLLGRDLGDGETRLRLEVALRGLDIIEAKDSAAH